MVRLIKGPSSKGYIGKTKTGKTFEYNRDGSIREYHDKWNDPIPTPPERKPEKKKDWEIPGIPYEHPPDNLVPLGGGFFMTPDDEHNKDPTNCEGNLADISPWCGGNPLTKQAIGINPEIKFDECNVWVEFQPVLAFVKLAPLQIAYRFPGNCRNEEPKDEPPNDPPPPGTSSGYGMWKIPNDDTECYCFVSQDFTDEGATWSYSVTEITCPGQSPYEVTFKGVGVHPESGPGDVGPISYPNTGNGFWYKYKLGESGTEYSHTYLNTSSPNEVVTNPDITPVHTVYWFYTNWTFGGLIGCIKGQGRACRLLFQSLANLTDVPPWESYVLKVDDVLGTDCRKPKRDTDKLPPPPLGPDKPCCMACCNPNNNNDNAILKEILAQVKKANKAIGSDEFPATFPKGLTKANRDTGQNIPDVANLLKQMVLYLDEVTGQYSIEIQVDDINPTQEGNQSQTFELKNQAETLAEMFGMMINNSMNSELMIQLCVKSLIETGVMRQQLHNTQSQVRTVTEYLGYKAEEKSEDVPFTFTVPQSDNINNFKMDDFLKSSQQKVEILKIDSKEVGKHRVYMLMLEKTAGIIKALFWRNLGKDAAAVAGKVKDLLKKQDATIKQVDKHDVELEAALEDFEKGYTDYTPYVGDSSKPYGDEYTARPKTRIIKKGTGTTTP